MAMAPARPRGLSARGIILMLILAAMLFSSVYPLRRYFDVRAQNRVLQQEESALDARMAELAIEHRELRSDAVIEQRAREELGFVRPGEVPFVIPKVKARTKASTASESPSAVAGSVFGRWWGAMTAILRNTA